MGNPITPSDAEICYRYFKEFFDKHGMNFEIDPEDSYHRPNLFVTLKPNSGKLMYWPWFGFIMDCHELSLGTVTVSLYDPDCLSKLEVNLPYFRGEIEKRAKYEPFH